MKQSVKLMFLLMAVLLTNGCQKKTDTPAQLQNETVISGEIEMDGEYEQEQYLEESVDNNLTPEIDIGIVNDDAVRI